MTDAVPTPEEAEKFKQWRNEGASPKAGPSSGGGDDFVAGAEHTAGRLAGATAATVEGMGKGIANVSGNLPTLVGLPALSSKWASSRNPNYPIAEGVGRLAPLGVGLAAMPEAGMEEAATNLVPELAKVPRIARAVGKVGEGVWKGYVGGGTQGDPRAGEATGAGSAAAWEALRNIPGRQYIVPAAIIGAAEMARGGYMPWVQRHALSYLAEMAAALSGKFPGIAGALGADIHQGKAP